MNYKILLLLLLALTACQPLRTIDTATQHTTDSTSVATHHESAIVSIRDTLYRHDVVHLTVIDTTYTREHIVIRYDRETGQPIERTEERTIQSSHILDSLSLRIAYLEHAIDSLRAADAWMLAHQSSDSLAGHTITERGDASLTPWQALIRALRRILWPISITILIIAILYLILRPKTN